MDSSKFLVQIVPFTEWVDFRINLDGQINVNDLYRHTLNVLRHVSGQSIPIERGEITYDVNVVSQINDKGQELETVSSNKMYRTFIDIPSTEKLTRLFNEEVSVEGDLMLDVSENDFVEARVIILAAPRDIARLFYRMPPLPESLDYEIHVYGNKPEEYDAIKQYDDKVILFGKTKLSQPLRLPLPMEPSEFPEVSRIIFVATRNDEVIGYCACQLLAYRTEILPYMKKKTEQLLNIRVDDEKADIFARYLMNVYPRNIYEIEGLSASPYEAGKNIGLALLYEALRFIRDPLMKKFYPVSHITSQAASYITKLYLVQTFQFRYHGGNNFLNESFVETLGDASKKDLVDLITQLLTYYNTFFETNTELVKMLAKKNEVIGEMLSNVMSLYQLYFLLLQSSSARPQSYNAYNTETLDQLIKLFDSLRKGLASNTKKPNRKTEILGTYFKVAYKHLKACRLGQCPLEDIADSIVWPESRATGSTDPPLYGFMYQNKNTKTKVTYEAGYNIIYSVWKNIIDLNKATQRATYEEEEEREMATRIFEMIDALIAADVEKDYDYELPHLQLDNILYFFRELNMSAYSRTTEKKLVRKLALLDNNTTFNKKFTTELYLVSEQKSSGFDCFISLHALSTVWNLIESNVFEKFKKRAPSVTAPVATAVVQNKLLNTPTDRETIFREINTLDKLITQSYIRGNPTAFFGGRQYTIDELGNYYNRLKVLQAMPDNAIEIIETDEEEEEEEMNVEVVDRHHHYRIEEFIEEIDLGPSVLNQSDI